MKNEYRSVRPETTMKCEVKVKFCTGHRGVRVASNDT